MTTLPAGVFDGLSSLTLLWLQTNRLTALPAGVFDRLSSLSRLSLDDNQLTTLPPGVFDGLSSMTELALSNNQLTALPEGVFNGLSSLNSLQLGYNQLTTIPAGMFGGLSSLTRLWLNDNRLTTLPEGVFQGLSSLNDLQLNSNQLTALPARAFKGVVSLRRLWLHGNSVNPMPFALSMEPMGESSFRAVAPAGAPFDLVLPIVVANGELEGGVQSVTIAAGETASPSFVVTRDTDANGALTVDIGTLPGLPDDHHGYVLEKTGPLPLEIGASGPSTGICDRTQQVRDAIVAAVAGVDDCADVTSEHLAGIAGAFDLDETGIASLQSRDFAGLSSLQHLWMDGNELTALPDGVFEGLSSLVSLTLAENEIQELPTGVFAGLSSLTQLWLQDNRLTALPVGVFAELSSLEILTLFGNELSALPVGVFDGLSSLTLLDLGGNELSSLPDDVFAELPLLTALSLAANRLTALPEGVFEGLPSLQVLWLEDNPVDPLPLGVTLEAAGDRAFRAVAPAGAPFEMVLPIVAANGRLDGEALSVTIAAGQSRSPAVEVTRDSNSGGAVTVDIGALPGLPEDHEGYALEKTGSLPLEIGALSGGICDRTPQVPEAIVAFIADSAVFAEAFSAGRLEAGGHLRGRDRGASGRDRGHARAGPEGHRVAPAGRFRRIGVPDGAVPERQCVDGAAGRRVL